MTARFTASPCRDADGRHFDIKSKIAGPFRPADVSRQHRRHRPEVSRQLRQADRDLFASGQRCPRDGGPTRDDTQIFYQEEIPLVLVHPAIDDEVVSVATYSFRLFQGEKGKQRADFLRRELHEINPRSRRRIPEVGSSRRLPLHPELFLSGPPFSAAKAYICLGDAHRFIDPIFSFGFYVSVFEAMPLSAPVTRTT